MDLHAHPDVSTAEETAGIVQLALFGDPVPIEDLDDPDQPTDEVAAVIEDSLAFRDQLTLFLDTFAEPDRTAAARGLYLDADGQPRTRHRLLRAV